MRRRRRGRGRGGGGGGEGEGEGRGRGRGGGGGGEDDDDGQILDGMGTDDGDEYFCSLKVHRLMTQTQRRTRDNI